LKGKTKLAALANVSIKILTRTSIKKEEGGARTKTMEGHAGHLGGIQRRQPKKKT